MSIDSFLGLPFNIASYALLTHIIAQIIGATGVGRLIFFGGDVHIYKNHLEQCEELVSRAPLPLPAISMPKFTSIDELLEHDISEFKLLGYECHSPIRAPMAV